MARLAAGSTRPHGADSSCALHERSSKVIGKPAASCDARAGDLADDLDGGPAQPNLGARPTRASRSSVGMSGRNPALHARLSARQLRKSAPGAGLARRRGCNGGGGARTGAPSRRADVESKSTQSAACARQGPSPPIGTTTESATGTYRATSRCESEVSSPARRVGGGGVRAHRERTRERAGRFAYRELSLLSADWGSDGNFGRRKPPTQHRRSTSASSRAAFGTSVTAAQISTIAS